MAWPLRYLDRQWARGRFECLDLVLEVSRKEFGTRPMPPPYAATAQGRDDQVARLAGEYAVPVAAPDLRDGDLAHMAPLGARTGGHHLGIVWCGEPEPRILHCAPRGTRLDAPAALARVGLELRGWYRWKWK